MSLTAAPDQEFDTRTTRPATRREAINRPQQRKFLAEVQGLRALAVLMVVAYHVWFGRISGGVDIFLLISAFLLTGQFTRKLESGRGLELGKYWAHLFKRLLPLVVITLLLTLLGVYLLLPETQWKSMFGQTWASLFYYQNWFLAAESVDYYAADHSTASPMQHFWSLSIQGQIFILWPLIFALAALVARVAKLRIRALLMYMFGAVFLTSLVFSIATTHSNQTFAYFDTRARLWEFALGSLLALFLPYRNFNRAVRVFLGWLGIVGMLSCGIILQVGQQFPGYMALWPTLSAAFIIMAGHTGSRVGADRFLSWKPLVKLGDSSYALYLLHWPILVFFLVWSDRTEAGPRSGTAIVLVSIVGAYFATKYIDTPLRRNKWIEQKRRRAVVTILICVSVVAGVLGPLQVSMKIDEMRQASRMQAAQEELLRNYPGALALQEGFVDTADPGLPMTPALTALDKQWVSLGNSCEGDFYPNNELLNSGCTTSTAVPNAKKTIVVIGDSHAEQFTGALAPVAKENDWQLVALWLGGCDFGFEDGSSNREVACQRFNGAALDYVLNLKPDAVSTVATDAKPDAPTETLIPGYERAVRTFVDAGIEVIGVRDNARSAKNIAQCVASDGPEACSFSAAEYLAASNPAESLNRIDGAHMIDLTDQYCREDICHTVIGNVLVYMDGHHLTSDFARTMAPALGKRLAETTGWKMK